jgi:transketolase
MRKTFYSILQNLVEKDSRIIALLGDIGVFSFQESMKKFPNRIYNFGIMEQTMVGAASGLAKSGFIPFVHSIAPFVTERCYEQLKLNLGYENANVFIVSAGNSYDYSGLGCSHQCPNDLRIVSSIPNFKTFCVGNVTDLKSIIEKNINISGPKYIRLSEFSNNYDQLTKEEINNLSSSNGGVCVVVGNAIKDFKKILNANINCSFYYTSDVSEFSIDNLKSYLYKLNAEKKITVIEPCYDCGILSKISLSIPKVELHSISIPKEFIESYGSKKDIDKELNLDDNSIIEKLLKIYDSTN